MGRPKLLSYDLLTTGQVARAIGISKSGFLYRLAQGFYPPPTKVESGNRYFSQAWLRKVKGEER